jgi:hypothetical protein
LPNDTPRHRRLDHQSPNAASEDLAIEIQEQSNRESQDTHVREQLGFVQSDEALDALDFDDDAILDNEVWSIFPNHMSLVQNWNRNLPLVMKASRCELETKRPFIRRLHQSRAELSMDLDAAADDCVSQRIVLVHVGLIAVVPLCAVGPRSRV